MSKRVRKILAVFMVLALVIGSIPVFAVPAPLTLTKTVTPVTDSAIADDCLYYDINLSLTGAMPPVQKETYDIVLVLDTSTSMDGTPLTNLKTAAKSFVDSMASYNPSCQIGIVKYSESASNVSGLQALTTTNVNSLKTSIQNLSTGVYTNIQAGILNGYNMLAASTSGNKKILIVMSDGVANQPYTDDDGSVQDGTVVINGMTLEAKRAALAATFVQTYAISGATPTNQNDETWPVYHTWSTAAAVLRAEKAISESITVYSIGMMDALANSSSNSDKACALLGADTLLHCATDANHYKTATTSTITDIYNEIATNLAAAVTVTDTINMNTTATSGDFTIVGSATASAGTASVTNGVLSWSFTQAQYTSGMNVSFRVKAKQRFVTENSGTVASDVYNAATNGRILSTASYTTNTNVGAAQLSYTIGSTPTVISSNTVADVTIPGFSVAADTSDGVKRVAAGSKVDLTATPTFTAGTLGGQNTNRCSDETVQYVWTVNGTEIQPDDYTVSADTTVIVTATTSAGHVASAVLELTTIKSVGIDVEKTIVTPTAASGFVAGQTVTYEVAVSNVGASEITNLEVDDNMTGLAGFSGPYTLSGSDLVSTAWPTTLAVGGSATRYYTYVIAADLTGVVTNTATADGTSDQQPVHDEDSAPFTIYVAPQPTNITVNVDKKVAFGTYTAANDTGVTWSPAISKTLASVGATETVTFKITVSAVFPAQASGIYFSVDINDLLDGVAQDLVTGEDDILEFYAGEGVTNSYTFYITKILGAGTHANVATISDLEDSDTSELYNVAIGTASATATVTLNNPQVSSQTSSITSSTSSGTPLTNSDPGAVSQTSSVASSIATTVIAPSSVPLAAPSSEAVVISEESVPTENPVTGTASSAAVYAVITLLTSGAALTVFARRKKTDK